MYYRQGSIEKIINLVEPNLNAIDLASELLVFYSFAKLEAGEVDQAKAYFEKAKSKGVTAKSLRNLLREDESTSTPSLLHAARRSSTHVLESRCPHPYS